MNTHFLLPILRYTSFTADPDTVMQPYAAPWRGHIAFARVLIAEFRPELLVELGTHYGVSFFALCEAVKEENLSTRCVAVDSWEGDSQAGFYGEEVYEKVKTHTEAHYGQWATLMRSLFDDAMPHFEDESIDVLHIDGLHTYEALRHDFDTWLPKVKAGGIILFHDVNEFFEDFGAYKVWDEIAPLSEEAYLFRHSHGLGVWRKPGAIPLDQSTAPLLATLLGKDKAASTTVATYITGLAEREIYRIEAQQHQQYIQQTQQDIQQIQQENEKTLHELHLLINEKDDSHRALQQQLTATERDLQHSQNTLNNVLNSRSWKLTSVLRMPRALLKRLGNGSEV